MHGYEFTGRGKAVSAILAVSLVLVVLSSVAALTAEPGTLPDITPTSPRAEQNTSPEVDILPVPPSLQPQTPETQPATQPAEEPQTQNNEPVQETEPQPIPLETATPKPARPTANDPEIQPPEDVLSFLFEPDSSTKLDSATGDLLDKFLSAPDHLPSYLIVAETPQLSESEKGTLLAAVTDALVSRGASADQLEHKTLQSTSAGGAIEVKLYYVPRALK